MHLRCSILLIGALAVLPGEAQSPDESCADQARVTSAVQRAFRALRQADPAARRALRDCAPHVTCGSPPAATRSHCTTELQPAAWGFLVTVRPRPARGVPEEMSVSVDTRNTTTEHVRVSGSRWSVGRQVAIVGVTEQHLHQHGGAAAPIRWARFRAWNDSGEALPLRVLDGSFRHNGREVRLAEVSTSVSSLPPGESTFEVGFSPQEAYQSWNDQFTARFRLSVGRQVLVPQAQFAVTRVEPLRE